MIRTPLRFHRLWTIIGALLIAFVVFLSLSRTSIDVPIAQGDKFGHVLAYATLMLFFAQIHSSRRERIGYAVGFVAMGIGLEFLQRLTEYRTFDIADMVADALGVALGWITAPPRSPNLLRRMETLLPGGS